ncbi:MAG TPA: GNAT family protein [Ignavibacteriaceae bacterium]|nr:GNAT family protein [Ignavibacteriaceae bacterium]
MNNVTLKKAEIEDANLIYKLIDESRENLRLWLPWVDISKSPIFTENYLIQNSLSDFYSGRSIFEILLDNNFCGMIDLHNGSKELKSVDIGYWVGEKYQGRNIATDACKLLINLVFKNYDIDTIFIRCAEENIKSRSIPQKLSFELCDTTSEILIRNKTYRLFVYSLRKSRWIALK